MATLLPTEARVGIIQHADRKTLPAVLRTSSISRLIAEPSLDSDVNLTPFFNNAKLADATIACLWALNIIDLGAVEAVFNTLGEALNKLLGLEKLFIMNRDDRQPPAQLSRGCSLWKLQRCYGPPEVAEKPS
ncbi:hypothetical protein FRC00_002406 [Tulasnella sp. 408]|nr:hypothetical protein FRC00_002406 [Tulasnella sp. 408]